MSDLDFVNSADDIQAAFEPWFETTLTEPTDPNLLYAKEREVMDYQLLVASEMESFIRVLSTAGPGRAAPERHRRPVSQLSIRELDLYGNQLERCLKALSTGAPIRADVQRELAAVHAVRQSRTQAGQSQQP